MWPCACVCVCVCVHSFCQVCMAVLISITMTHFNAECSLGGIYCAYLRCWREKEGGSKRERERERKKERKKERERENFEPNYTRIEILGSCLLLHPVLAVLHAKLLHMKQH